jgi:diguanylate cyclase (GGDEF)-like protein/PAS domain S-box-containing protein
MVEHSPKSGFINKYFSNNIEELTGYPRYKFMDDWGFWPSIVHPEDKTTYLHNQKKMLNGESMETEYRIVHANGSSLWVHDNAHVTYKSDGTVMIYATIFNITERKQNENRIRYLATHDPLTKLPNRIMFREILEHALEFAKRNEQKLAVFFLDIDKFKEVNDTYGHQIGDELLKMVAKRLTHNLRKHDTVSRISGDEFTLITEQINRESHVEVVARKIHQILDGDYEIAGNNISVSVSVGGSIFPTNGDTYDILIQKADAAMYKAKYASDLHYWVYTEE